MLTLKRTVIADEQNQIGFDEHGQFSWIEQRGDEYRQTWIADLRGKKCSICGRTWENTPADITNQTCTTCGSRWAHRTCFEGHLTQNHFNLFYDALGAAGFRCDDKGIVEIPNQYGGAWNTAWFKTTGDCGGRQIELTFGRRKRVYEIIARPVGEVCFFGLTGAECPKEDVTKELRDHKILIHAWSDEKVKEYIKIICGVSIIKY